MHRNSCIEQQVGLTSGRRRARIASAIVGSIVAAALAIAAITSTGYAAMAPDADPMSVAKTTVNEALQVLADRSTPLGDRQEKLKQIVAAGFDYTEMSRSAMGYHWRQLSPDQQNQFIEVFTSFIQDSYLSKINDYQGQQVDFVKSSADEPDYAQVYSNIRQDGKPPLPVNYRLKKTSSGWKIYDVTVDAISIIANYRNQFNRVMNSKGYSTLIDDLKSKQASISAGLGEN
ncbi:MAG: MlaC/ttg2D family ABC transporter substrate-binding protein [Gammaproteobacteria bacterium]